MMPAKPDPGRDDAIRAMLPQVADCGWTSRALRAGLTSNGADASQAAWLFDGPADMVEAYLDFSDRRMEAAAAGIQETRVSARVRALIALRLVQAREERIAARRAVAVLSVPTNAAAAARTLARTVDAIWHAAGDRSADFSWYSKRAILAAVYGATLLDWLRHDEYSDPADAQTLEFLDRRLDDARRIGRAGSMAADRLRGLLPERLRANPPSKAGAPEPPPKSPPETLLELPPPISALLY